MLGQVEGAINFLPSWLADIIATEGLDVALDLLIDITTPYTGAYIYQELHGLADGAGVDYKTAARIHLIGELSASRERWRPVGMDRTPFPHPFPSPLSPPHNTPQRKATAPCSGPGARPRPAARRSPSARSIGTRT
jgi:hypothetical protein